MGPVVAFFSHAGSQIWLSQLLVASKTNKPLSRFQSKSCVSLPPKLEQQAARRQSVNLFGTGTFSNCKLKGPLSENRRAVPCGKRLLLFKQLLAGQLRHTTRIFSTTCVSALTWLANSRSLGLQAQIQTGCDACGQLAKRGKTCPGRPAVYCE